MSTYRNTTTGEIRDIDDQLVAAWQAAGNPKAGAWEPYTPPPPAEPDPVRDYAALWAGLLVSEVFRTVRAQAVENLPVAVAYADFAAAMAVALGGNPIVGSIQASLWSVLRAATLSAENLAEVQGLLEAAHLDGILSLDLPQ